MQAKSTSEDNRIYVLDELLSSWQRRNSYLGLFGVLMFAYLYFFPLFAFLTFAPALAYLALFIILLEIGSLVFCVVKGVKNNHKYQETKELTEKVLQSHIFNSKERAVIKYLYFYHWSFSKTANYIGISEDEARSINDSMRRRCWYEQT